MRTILLLLSLLCLNSCLNSQTYISNGKVTNIITVGDEWVPDGDKVRGVGGRNYLLSEDLVPSHDFSLEALLSLEKLDKSGAAFCFFGNNLVFNSNSSKHESPMIVILELSWSGITKTEVVVESNQYIKANEKFKFEVQGKDGKIKFSINDKEVYTFDGIPDTLGTIGFSSGRSILDIYDFSVKAKLEKQEPIDYLFKHHEDGYSAFRIPALAVTNNGTVLAFAEGRKNSTSDTGDIDIVLKRSNDSGQTWSEVQLVWSDAENTCGNPVPVVDKETGTIFLLTTRNLGTDPEWKIINNTSEDTRRVFVMESKDDGVTWSEPEEITKDVKQDDWTWYATGPCQGIQIEQGPYKGRLVVPCDHIEKESKKYYSHIIYSDDHGKTWKLGGRTPVDMVNECTVAEIDGGNLVLNMRNYNNAMRNRQVSISEDGGLTWGELTFDDTLIEPICQAGMHRYSFADEGKSRLLFTNPANKTRRANMVLRISYDDGQTWPVSKVLYPGSTAYSDVIRLPNGNIGAFYEAGYVYPYEGIVFESLSLSELEK